MLLYIGFLCALLVSSVRVAGPGPQFGSSISINEQGTVAVVSSAARLQGFGGTFSVLINTGSTWDFHPDSPFKLENNTGPWVGGYSPIMDVSIWNMTIVCGCQSTRIVSGTVWIFDYNGSTWRQTATIHSPDRYALFGYSVSIYKDTIAVGAPMLNRFQGAVWVIELEAGVWGIKQKLQGVGSRYDTLQLQGISVAVWENTIVTGGPYDDYYSGSLWVFERGVSEWAQFGDKLGFGEIGFLALGHSVAINNDTIVAGAWLEGYPVTVGAVYVFDKLINGSWSRPTKLIGSHTYTGQLQGTSVSLRGNRLAVSCAIGPVAGFLFERNASGWHELEIFYPDGYPGIDLAQDTPGKNIGLAPNCTMIGGFPRGDNGALWILE